MSSFGSFAFGVFIQVGLEMGSVNSAFGSLSAFQPAISSNPASLSPGFEASATSQMSCGFYGFSFCQGSGLSVVDFAICLCTFHLA